MRAVLMHVPLPNPHQGVSGYRRFLRDAANLIPPGHALGEDSWLIPETDFQQLEPGLNRLCHASQWRFATLVVETIGAWIQHP